MNRYGKRTTEAFIARPGHSEHQTGLAVDILQGGFTGSPLCNARFQNTKQYTWLMAHDHEFGFILRHPNGKQDVTGFTYEPWHWRDVGVAAATEMWEKNIVTFEEYHTLLENVKEEGTKEIGNEDTRLTGTTG